MKNQNFPVLLVVIAVIAVLAQLARHGPDQELEDMRQDMVVSLSRLWVLKEQQVELAASGNRVEARASVKMPQSLRMRVKRWNYPFLHFVAAQHPKFQLENLQVREAGNPQVIPEYALNGLLAERAYRQPGPDEQEERFCQMTARQWSAALDRQLGTGHALVLVDGQEARSGRDLVYGRRAGGAPVMLNDTFARMLVNQVCVVTDRSAPADWPERFKKENPTLAAVPMRTFALP